MAAAIVAAAVRATAVMATRAGAVFSNDLADRLSTIAIAIAIALRLTRLRRLQHQLHQGPTRDLLLHKALDLATQSILQAHPVSTRTDCKFWPNITEAPLQRLGQALVKEAEITRHRHRRYLGHTDKLAPSINTAGNRN